MTTIRICENGPYLVEGGEVTLVDGNDREYRPVNRARFALCRCGQSANKPFCDGTHSRIGFTATESAR